MLFQVKTSPKQLERLNKPNITEVSAVPKRWEDFAETLTIRSGKGYQRFTPFPMQIQLSDLVDAHPFAMVPKTRQLGISQWALSKILHEMLKTPGINCVVVSRRNLDAYKLGRRMIQMIDSASIPTIRKSAAEVVTANGSRCIFAEPGENSARGEDSVSIILLDEFGHYSEPELTMASVLPATGMVEDLRCWLVFTPNGKSHYSFQLLNSSNPDGIDTIDVINKVRAGSLPPVHHWVDKDEWLKILIHWRSHPIYGKNPNYLQDTAKRQKLSWKKCLREYDLSFDESELQYIPDEDIDACAIGEYEKPEEGIRYYAGLDSSSVGSDYFCFAVLKEEGVSLSLVHLYRARRRSMKRHLVRIGSICEDYQIEAATVETNSFGQLYYEDLNQAHPKVKWSRFTASQRTNTEIMERMLMQMEERTLIYPDDEVVLREFRGLEQDPMTGKIEAAITSKEDGTDNALHDDIPRAIALAIHCFEHSPRKPRIDISKIQVIADATSYKERIKSENNHT